MNCGKVPQPGARSTPFGGARAAGTGKLWSVCITVYAAHNTRGQRRGGKVPQPGARSTPFGVARAAGTGKLWSVCITIYAAHN